MSAKFSLLKYILQCHIWKGENCDVIHVLYSFKQRVCIELKWEVLKVTNCLHCNQRFEKTMEYKIS